MMAIPIIGQPKIKDWCLTFILECSCGAAWLFTGAIGATMRCPGHECRKVYRIQGPPSTADGVNLDIPLGMMELPQ